LLALFTATLDTESARVIVGPPLSCSAPRLGFVLFMSPVPANAHVESLLMLSPCEIMDPPETLQFPPVLFEMIVFFNSGSHPVLVRLSPAPAAAVLWLIVTFNRFRVTWEPSPLVFVLARCRIPPPESLGAVTTLFVTVTFVSSAS
jgi:hypothetical protein